jgi:CBS domain-containing protein
MPTLCPSCGTRNLEGADECANCGADLRTVDLPRPKSRLEQALMTMPLTTLTLSPMTRIAPDAPLVEAVTALRSGKVDILAVTDSEGHLLGVLSVRDVMTRGGADYAAKMNTPVEQLMTRSPETLGPDAPIGFAINMMDVGGYRHVPIVQHDHLLGVVSTRDVIKYLIRHGKESVPTMGLTTSHGVAPEASAAKQVGT